MEQFFPPTFYSLGGWTQLVQLLKQIANCSSPRMAGCDDDVCSRMTVLVELRNVIELHTLQFGLFAKTSMPSNMHLHV